MHLIELYPEPRGHQLHRIPWAIVMLDVDKFKNLPGAPVKARADVAPEIPDQIVDFVDIPWVVDAFRGLPYPWGPSADPCP